MITARRQVGGDALAAAHRATTLVMTTVMVVITPLNGMIGAIGYRQLIARPVVLHCSNAKAMVPS